LFRFFSTIERGFLLNASAYSSANTAGCSAGAQKQYGLGPFEESFADEIQQACRSTSGINRIKPQTFRAWKQLDRFSLPFGDNTIASARNNSNSREPQLV